MILAGDVGGTKTVVALFEELVDGIRQVRDAEYHSPEHQSLQEILGRFLSPGPVRRLEAACFGVPGAVIEGRCETTNLPWTLDERSLARTIGAAHVKLLNDLEAAAYGTLHLPPEELCVLNPGTRPRPAGNIAVIAAGTGLGETMLYWDGTHYHPVASEGGHANFAPRTDQEIELLRYLRGKFGHVSYERVLSGPGLHNIYAFLRDSGAAPEPAWLTEKLASGDPSAMITQVALAGEDATCIAALNLFCSIYGAEAGNLALKCLAVGGVFVAGGIAPKVLPALQAGSFVRAFTDKGRLADLMRGIAVSVVLNVRAPLLGAARYAQRLAQ